MNISDDPTLRIEAKFKNARLYNAIQGQSVQLSSYCAAETLHKSGPVKAFCELHDLNLSAVYDLLNLKMGPVMVGRRGIRPICERLGVLLEQSVGWLFPSELYAVTWPRLAAEVDHRRFIPLLAASRHPTLSLPASQEDTVLQRELRDVLQRTMKTLTPREEHVLERRFGLNVSDEQTLADIAQGMQLSVERVRQIEARALRKMRHSSRAGKLRGYIDVRA